MRNMLLNSIQAFQSHKSKQTNKQFKVLSTYSYTEPNPTNNPPIHTQQLSSHPHPPPTSPQTSKVPPKHQTHGDPHPKISKKHLPSLNQATASLVSKTLPASALSLPHPS